MGEDKSSFMLASLLLFTFPGAPSIFYGDEVGLPGGKDPDCRRAFPQPENWDTSILKDYKEMIALRHQYAALRTGTYEILYADNLTYIFARILDDSEVIVAVNSDTKPVTVIFPASKLKSQPDKLLYGEGRVVWHTLAERNDLEITLAPRSGFVIA